MVCSELGFHRLQLTVFSELSGTNQAGGFDSSSGQSRSQPGGYTWVDWGYGWSWGDPGLLMG